jgi:hypothetical protein
VIEVDVKGSLRHHVHEYLKSPGGDVEELARKLYQITMRSEFHDVFPKWPDLYLALGDLMALFETGISYPLHIPTVGTITAKCIEWDRRMVAKVRSGESATFTFIEAQETQELAERVLDIGESLASKLGDFEIAIDQTMPGTSLFDGILGAAHSVLAVVDQVELTSALVVAQLESFTTMCNELDQTLTDLDKPANHEVLEAFHELWAAVGRLARDSLRLSTPIDLFIVPATMAVTQVAIKIYGNTDRAVELLKLNALDDALAIPRNTVIRHYAKAA